MESPEVNVDAGCPTEASGTDGTSALRMAAAVVVNWRALETEIRPIVVADLNLEKENYSV